MIITRFAPSPTGLLHVGSVRPALVNYLFALKFGGKFILRIDDTDLARSTDYFKEQLLQDLKWLGLEWGDIFYQSQRIDRYNEIVNLLIESGRLYECFETAQELDLKRKIQLSSGKPPIYDRAALKLTVEQKQRYVEQGRKAHYRFKLEHKDIQWQDLIRGSVKYKAQDLSDPIVIREDGTFTYMLCSAIDDSDYAISHIFRGEDHINNTAIQLQMLEAIGATIPVFGHLSFLKSKEDKISKRVGGFEVQSLAAAGIEPMAINSFFAFVGTSRSIAARKSLADLASDFDVASFSSSPTIYNEKEIELLNHKLLISLEFSDVAESLAKIGLANIDEQFWLAARANLNKLQDIGLWWQICKNPLDDKDHEFDISFFKAAAEFLPLGIFDQDTWGIWTAKISAATGKKGKELYLPLRLKLTGLEHGPEMKYLLPLIGREEVVRRINLEE